VTANTELAQRSAGKTVNNFRPGILHTPYTQKLHGYRVQHRMLSWAQPLGVAGGSGHPKNILTEPPTFYVAFWWGLVGTGDNRRRQTGYTFLDFFWRRAVIPYTKKLDPPTLKTRLRPCLLSCIRTNQRRK